MTAIKSKNTILNFTDYQLKKQALAPIPVSHTDVFTFDSFALKPRKISFLPDHNNPDRISKRTLKVLPAVSSIVNHIMKQQNDHLLGRKEIGVPIVPPITNDKSSMKHIKLEELPPISESAVTNNDIPHKEVNSAGSDPHASSAATNEDNLLKPVQKAAALPVKELIREDSEESVEEHAYISYSYIEAKKAQARSAHIQEDRPTRLRKFMNVGSLSRNYTDASSTWGDTHGFTAAEKWRFVIETVIKLLKSFHQASSLYEYDTHYQDADTVYSLFKYHQEVALSTKIQHYFEKQKRGVLSEAERARLDHLLCERIPLFQKLSYEQKVRLCLYVKYERHAKGTHLFTQGAEAGYVYYILNGQIQLISKNIENSDIALNHVNIGSVINPDNADGTWQEHSLRLSTAFLNADSDFLSFDRRDYWNILRGEDTSADLLNRVKIMKSLSTFSREDESLLELAAQKTTVKYFPRDHKIVTQGHTNKLIHWIVSGKVRVDKTTPFIAKIDVRNTVRPDTSNNHISSKEKRIEETLMIGCLQFDDFFPEPFQETIPSIGVDFDRLDLITKLTDYEALGFDKSTVSVTALSPIVCLVMQRIDFCRVMSMDMYRSLHNESSIYFIKHKPLQLEWISRIEWTKQKKAVVKDIMKDFKAEKERRKECLQNWVLTRPSL